MSACKLHQSRPFRLLSLKSFGHTLDKALLGVGAAAEQHRELGTLQPQPL